VWFAKLRKTILNDRPENNEVCWGLPHNAARKPWKSRNLRSTRSWPGGRRSFRVAVR